MDENNHYIIMKTSKGAQYSEQEHVNEDRSFAEGNNPADNEEGSCVNLTDGEAGEGPAPEKMTDEAAEWRDRYIRLQAEFDNYRKRTLKEKMDLVSSAGEDVIKALLPVLDDFDRALEAMECASDVVSVREGVVLISHKLRDTLRNKGVSEIESIGRKLDVDFHEAVAKIPAPNKNGKGMVVDCVQKGYTLKDKVIRHAKVVVGE